MQQKDEATGRFQLLKKEERQLNHYIKNLPEIFEVELKQKEYGRNLLQKQINELEIKIGAMEERINFDEIPQSLLNDYRKLTREETDKDNIKLIYGEYVEMVLEQLKGYLKDQLLTCSSELDENPRETYRVYGLLLSACNLKQSQPKDTSIDKVLVEITQPPQQKSIKKDFVSDAVRLTHTMLTVLPPLIIVVPKDYEEQLHDTNRMTWDDSSTRRELIYYRPILIFGNQLHQVAVKGLVGNCKSVITSETSDRKVCQDASCRNIATVTFHDQAVCREHTSQLSCPRCEAKECIINAGNIRCQKCDRFD